MNLGEPKYFILAEDPSCLGEYCLITELNNKGATERVNKLLMNGYKKEDLVIICGYNIPILTD